VAHSKSYRWRKWLALGALLLILILCGLVLLPFSPLRKTAKQQFTSWLTTQWGRGAKVGDIHLSWRRVSAELVVLPLDDKGSQLTIKRLDVTLDLFQLLNQPGQFERTIRRIRISSPQLVLVGGDTNRQDGASWIPKVTISRRAYSVFERLDSLQLLEFDSARVLLAQGNGKPLEVCSFWGSIRQDNDTFRLAARGTYLGDPRDTLFFSAELSPVTRRLSAECTATIPRGQVLPMLNFKPIMETDGGHVVMMLRGEDSTTSITALVNLASLQTITPAGTVRAEDIIAQITADTLRLEKFQWSATGISGPLAGFIRLAGKGELSLSGTATIQELARLPWFEKQGWDISGSADAKFSIAGTVSHPAANAALSAPRLSWQGMELTDARIHVNVDNMGVHIDSASAATSAGRVDLSGDLQWGPMLTCAGEARFDLTEAPTAAGWKSNLRSICATIKGSAEHPELAFEFLANDGIGLGNAAAQKTDSVWIVDVYPQSGRPAHVRIQPWQEGVRASVENPDGLLSLLFGQKMDSLNPFETLHMQFTGNAQAGDVECTATIKPDSTSLWSRVLQTLYFSGRYAHSALQRLDVSGTWSGLNGDGEPFEGQTNLTLADSVLTITRLFVDVIGNITGWVDFRNHTLNLDAEMSELEFRRLPFRPSAMRRLNLEGKLAGFAHVEGTLAKPSWTAGIAATNVSLEGLENYWMNAEVAGEGLQITIRNLELGRDVHRILSISGTVNGETQDANLTAEASAVNSEDLLAAITGKGGFINGQLVGHATLRGELLHPKIDAHVAVGKGMLFSSIVVDTLDTDVSVGANERNEQTIHIPNLFVGKNSTYQFTCTMDIVPSANALRAHVEGNGDFLDIVDQLDKTYATLGSIGSFSLDLGGTFSDLTIDAGNLSVSNGRFSYADITPYEVSTDIRLRLAAPGVMDSGYVHFAEGSRWLNLRLAPLTANDQTVEALVIPKLNLTLGVIEIETGENGMPLRLPGLMKPEWDGSFVFGTRETGPVSISGFGAGRLLIAGNAAVDNARFTYPLISGSGHPKPVARWLLNRLDEARWDLNVAMGTGNHYDVTITGLRHSAAFSFLNSTAVLGTLTDYLDRLTVDAVVSPSDAPLHVVGTLADHSFRVSGQTTAERGKVEFLDQTFDVDYARADFDETSEFPIVEGRAQTMGQDTLGRRVPVYLTMYQIDRETNTRQKRGRLENATFVLESEGAASSEEALALLGLTPTQVEGTAGELVARTAARTLARQVLGPLERRIEKWTLLDEVTLSPGGGSRAVGARLQQNRTLQDSLQQGATVRFLTGSQFTLGKYVTQDLFLTYTGELAAGPAEAKSRLGLIHNWNLEYRMKPLSRDLVLDFAVEYDAVERRRDETVAVKYSFPLEP
jgi:hypothetical protein